MQTISGFLSELGFLQTWEEMAPVEEAFLDHMQKGLAGQPSSMPMLPAYLGVEGGAQEARDVIVMDAGGTNLRVSLLRLAPGQKPQTLYHHVQPMPGKAKPLEREAFFLELAKAVAPVADQSDRIGFCFSFPCRTRPDYDGEILYLDKEITVDNIEGALVAQGLRDALATLGAPCHQRVVILNDTVAALLQTGHGECVRQAPPQVDKQAVRRLSGAELQAAGIRLQSQDVFFWEPAAAKLPEPPAS